jgi:hypothetical protein
VQCSAVQCSAVQCSAVQCSAVQCSAVQCSAVQCSAVQCGINICACRLILLLEEHLEENESLTLLLVKQKEDTGQVLYQNKDEEDMDEETEGKEEMDYFKEEELSEVESQSENEWNGDSSISPKETKPIKKETKPIKRRRKLNRDTKEMCDYCKKLLKPSSMFAHVQLYHVKDPKFVNMVEKSTMVKERLCKVCNETFQMSAQQIFNHKQKCEFDKTGILKYICEICGSAFPTSTKCRSHWSTCSGKSKEWAIKKCDYENCDFTNKNNQFLENHIRTVHLNLPKKLDHVCNHCGKAYNVASRLKNHINAIHLNIRPFECEVCGKTFTTRPRLTDHVNLHKGILNYHCPFCEKAFGNTGALCNHKRTCALRESCISGKPNNNTTV